VARVALGVIFGAAGLVILWIEAFGVIGYEGTARRRSIHLDGHDDRLIVVSENSCHAVENLPQPTNALALDRPRADSFQPPHFIG
jgi:hypothetical protein